MSLRNNLLEQLSDGRFHSGELLGKQLGVSRAAVWKHFKAIESELGLQVQAVQGRGYRLASPIELLHTEQVKNFYTQQTKKRIGSLYIHHSVDSTNSWLMQQAGRGAESGSVCLAEQQSAGKGRHGRRWVSPFGRNIYLSLLWRFDMAPGEVAGMSLAAGIAVLRSLHQIGCHEAGLKWPNDILWRQRKLAGLLLEVSGEVDGASQVIIGVGLNTSLQSHGQDIDQPWTDLASIPDLKPYSRNELAASLINNLLAVIETYQQSGLVTFMDEWEQNDLLKGGDVVVHSANRAYQGKHLGIDRSGAIRLLVDGQPKLFFAGEVSLRGNAK